MGNLPNENSLADYTACNDNDPEHAHLEVCYQYVCDSTICEVQKVKLLRFKDPGCAGMNQKRAFRKINFKHSVEDHNNHDPSVTQLLLYEQTCKIFHQNIRSLRYKMNELLCHLNRDPPHIMCLTEHHLLHEELAILHAENYVLGSSYCRKSKQKGGVCICVHNSIKFTSLVTEEYCEEQNCEMGAIQINVADEKLCVLAVYRSPLGNFNKFLTNFELILQKFFNLNYNFIVCGDFNVDCCTESSKKIQLNKILQSFNLRSTVNFPTRISSNSFSTIDNFFINNSYLTNFDVSPLINGLSDHNGQLLTLQLARQYTRDQGMYYYKRLVTRTTIDDFLLKLSLETWASVFEVNDVNIQCLFKHIFETTLGLHLAYLRPVNVREHCIWN